MGKYLLSVQVNGQWRGHTHPAFPIRAVNRENAIDEAGVNGYLKKESKTEGYEAWKIQVYNTGKVVAEGQF